MTAGAGNRRQRSVLWSTRRREAAIWDRKRRLSRLDSIWGWRVRTLYASLCCVCGLRGARSNV